MFLCLYLFGCEINEKSLQIFNDLCGYKLANYLKDVDM